VREILSCNSISAEKFNETFLNMIKREGYTRNDIYNADETGYTGRHYHVDHDVVNHQHLIIKLVKIG